MILKLTFPGEAEADYSSYLMDQSVRINMRLMNEDRKSVVDTCSFKLSYDQTLQAELFTANDWIMLDLDDDDGSDLFTGVIAPTFGLRKKTNVMPISVEAIDNSYLLDEPIHTSFNYPDSIGGTAYQIFNADNSSSNVCWELLDDAGYTPASDIASGAPDLTTTVEYFQGTEGDETYREYLDDLLSEYGHVLYFNAAGEFSIYQWDKDTVTSTFTIDEDMEIRKRDVQYDGVEVEFAQTATDSNARLYLANLPITGTPPNAGFEGEAISNNDYYPPDGDINDIWQRYRVYWLDKPFLDRKTRERNEDLALIAADVTDDTVEFLADDGIAISSSTYEAKRAKVLFQNTSGDTAKIYAFGIFGTALYRKYRRFVKCPADPDNPRKHVARFIYDNTLATVQTNAQRFARALNSVIQNGSYIYEWSERTDRSLGDIGTVNMTDPSINQTVVILDKVWNPQLTSYNYRAQGIAEYSATAVTEWGESPETVPTPEQTATTIAEDGLIGNNSAVGAGDNTDNPSIGDVQTYMGKKSTDTTNGFRIKGYNGEEYETRGELAMRSGGNVADLFVSGFFEAGESVLSSPGLIWTEVATTSFSGTRIYGIAYGNETFVAGGDGGKIGYSTDGGDPWTQASSPGFGTSVVYSVAFGNDTFVAVGGSDKIAYSTDDGVTWTQVTTPGFGGNSVSSVAYGNGTFVATDLTDGKIGYSTDDGVTWSQVASPGFSSRPITDVTYGNGTFVAVGFDGRIGYSTDDGVTWTQVASPGFGTTPILGVVYGDGVFVAVASSGKIGYSTDDAVTWTQVSSPGFGTTAIQDVTYGDNVFVAYGNDGKIGRSTDGGRTWGAKLYGDAEITQPFGTDGSFLDAAYSPDDKRFVIVGYLDSDDSSIIAYSDWLEAGSGIVEQGSTDDGEYVIFSSGYMRCWGYYQEVFAVTTSSAFGGYLGGSSTVSFPKTFASAPNVRLSVRLGMVSATMDNSGDPTTTGFDFNGRTIASSASRNRAVYWVAEGMKA